jgi:hypothetical protein
MKCSVEGCGRELIPHRNGKGMCSVHYNRWWRHGDPNKGPTGWSIDASGYRVSTGKDKKYEHVMLAEKAIGSPLPAGVVVHHMNENPSDNHTLYNLVICPDQAYHFLLHMRMRAKKACGNPDWVRCDYCKNYDDPLRMISKPKKSQKSLAYHHRECRNAYRRMRYKESHSDV